MQFLAAGAPAQGTPGPVRSHRLCLLPGFPCALELQHRPEAVLNIRHTLGDPPDSCVPPKDTASLVVLIKDASGLPATLVDAAAAQKHDSTAGKLKHSSVPLCFPGAALHLQGGLPTQPPPPLSVEATNTRAWAIDFGCSRATLRTPLSKSELTVADWACAGSGGSIQARLSLMLAQVEPALAQAPIAYEVAAVGSAPQALESAPAIEHHMSLCPSPQPVTVRLGVAPACELPLQLHALEAPTGDGALDFLWQLDAPAGAQVKGAPVRAICVAVALQRTRSAISLLCMSTVHDWLQFPVSLSKHWQWMLHDPQ